MCVRRDPIHMAAKVMALLDDPDRREAMSRIGRQRVERELAWFHQAPRLLASYDTLWLPDAVLDSRPLATEARMSGPDAPRQA